jgi:hypothetical protein
MERGRTNYLRLLGTNQHAQLQEARNDAPGFAFVVRSMTIDLLKPAVLDDVLDVVTLPQEFGVYRPPQGWQSALLRRRILVRAFSVVNIHLMRAFEALRWRSQAAISDTSCF